MTANSIPAAAAAPCEDMLFAGYWSNGHSPEEFSEADRRDVELFFRLVEERKALRAARAGS